MINKNELENQNITKIKNRNDDELINKEETFRQLLKSF